jgi:hypothetical protein
MAQPIAPDYGQQFLFPPALEDWVAADHPARFLREFVDQLDLPALGFAMPAAVEGRPPYAPRLRPKAGFDMRAGCRRAGRLSTRSRVSLEFRLQPGANGV